MNESDPKGPDERRPYRVQRRLVSVAEALRLLPGRDSTVREWLTAEGLILSLPWGGTGVDMDQVYSRVECSSGHELNRVERLAVPFGHPGEVSRPKSGEARTQPAAAKSALRRGLRRRNFE